MDVYMVESPEFARYGQVLEGYDTKKLIETMNRIPMPDQGTLYEPSIEAMESCEIFNEFQTRFFGGMPAQLGMCWGYNTKMNCLEYHRDSEVNIGSRDFILLVASRQDIKQGIVHTDKVRAFLAKAGQAVELYATTLHYAPCHTDDAEGFRVAVILPRGTNTELFESVGETCLEDKWITARNKWLLAHPESPEAENGAYIGIEGDNIDIREEGR